MVYDVTRDHMSKYVYTTKVTQQFRRLGISPQNPNAVKTGQKYQAIYMKA
jgi:hypothetical protein